jgi:ankyrin repeat protein
MNCFLSLQTGAVKALLDFEASVHSKNKTKDTALHEACKENHLEIIQLLLREKADLYAVNTSGKTPLELCTPETRGKLKGKLGLFHKSKAYPLLYIKRLLSWSRGRIETPI